MVRYHNYRRNTHQIGQIPTTTLRRWMRLGRLIYPHENHQRPVEDNADEDDRMEFEGFLDDGMELHDNGEEEAENSRCSTPLSSMSAASIPPESFSSDEDFSDDESLDGLDDDMQNNEDEFSNKLHNNTNITLGETIFKILDFFIKNNLTKTALYSLLELLNFFLPKPNILPKSKYFLMKFIDSILPDNGQIIEKHRFCESCGDYLGIWNKNLVVSSCSNCSSSNINGLFVEYNLKSVLKDAFELKNLKYLIDQHHDYKKVEENLVCDITSGVKYQKLKEEVIKEKYDLCLLWNTDGIPFSNSSNAQVWLVQAQIVNIPPQNRRNYQFVCGIYYSVIKKPCMKSFLLPFAESLNKLYEDGIDWYDKDEKIMVHSTVIAPVATLDAVARADVQNIMLHNGAYGCTCCEHEGQTCETGAGFNRVYPFSEDNPPLFRTKERMYLQAQTVISDNLEHCKGVKGPSITALIPFFDVAESFVPDYMHSILLGVSRMLFNLWFNPKYHNRDFYVKKSFRDEIDADLKEIYPPDFVTRTPRALKYIKYFKASEVRECLLNYFPILLKDKLNKQHYQHYLLLVFATRLLLQNEIHVREIEIADSMLHLFSFQVEKLYGLEKCSFNVHQMTHIARNVLFWGPLSSWSAFPFEDANGYIKRTVHGCNKIDMEIANTLKLLNAHKVLKHKLGVSLVNYNSIIQPQGKAHKQTIFENELEDVKNFCLSIAAELENVKVFLRVKIASTIFTSEVYQRQKKRNNFYVFLNDSSFGSVLYYLLINNVLYAIIRKLECNNQARKICIPSLSVDLSNYLIPFRETYCIKISPVEDIRGKVMRVKDFLCLPANMYEKNSLIKNKSKL